MMRRTLPALLALALSSGATGCLTAGLNCTDIGFYSGLVVQMTGNLPAGSYELYITADGKAMVTEFDLTADNVLTCVRPPDGGQCVIEADIGDRRIRVVNELFTTGGMVNVYYLDGSGPADIKVQINQGATVVASQAYRPDYTTSEPNGNGCGDVTAAQVTLEVPSR